MASGEETDGFPVVMGILVVLRRQSVIAALVQSFGSILCCAYFKLVQNVYVNTSSLINTKKSCKEKDK
jgi:hypothetical protein